MLFLLVVPVLVLVTSAHRYLQRYAPSNVMIARARTARPRWRSAVLLAVLAATTLAAMHLVAEAVAAGAPGWLNLVVLFLAWDSIKFGLTAARVVLDCTIGNCRRLPRQSRPHGGLDRSRRALGGGRSRRPRALLSTAARLPQRPSTAVRVERDQVRVHRGHRATLDAQGPRQQSQIGQPRCASH